MNRREVKHIDNVITETSIGTSATMIGSLNLIAQGVGPTNRIGRKCLLHSMHWKLMVQLDSVEGDLSIVSDDSGTLLRIIIYIDKQCNGSAATATDILESDTWSAFRNLENTGRFHMLHDQTYALNFSAIGGGTSTFEIFCGTNRFVRISKALRGLPIEFSSTTGAITEIKSNNIGMLIIAEYNTTPVNARVIGQCRVRFTG